MTTTTTAIPIAITCPSGCEVPAEKHVDELWDQGGECMHYRSMVIPDPVSGSGGRLRDEVTADPIGVELWTIADPHGRESSAPGITVDGVAMSIAHAEALAAGIRRLVALYREEGGL